jgi:hypothetical protein
MAACSPADMEIVIDVAAAGSPVTLHRAEDFGAFKVVVRGEPGPDAVATALAPYGRLAPDGHAFIDPAGLEELAGPAAADSSWRESLAAMLSHAASKGWIEPLTGAVQAHVEQEDV